jgi:N-acetylneuraminic acid mutarotase
MSSLVEWKKIDSVNPRPRSLHAGVIVENHLYIFAGFDGTSRLNDLHRFDFGTKTWTHVVPSNGIAPSPRDRLAATSFKESMYIFGGFDGSSRVGDLWRFDSFKNSWHSLEPVNGGPSARHSHSFVEWNGKLYLLFGYDGNYRNDVWEYSISRKTWLMIASRGDVPKPRYRSTAIVYSEKIYVFGGHDGSHHLNDLHVFDLKTGTWTFIEPIVPTTSMGPYTITPVGSSSPPSPRDSHSAVVYGDSMFVFGGSSGTARNDLYEYRFDLNVWIELFSSQPCARFCHVAVVFRETMYVFAGYDGQNRLGDLQSYSFVDNVVLDVPPPSILSDLKNLVNSPRFSDIILVAAQEEFFGHKIILSRCRYFEAMFASSMAETQQPRIQLTNVSPTVLHAVLYYLYTDELIPSFEGEMMDLFLTADRYGIERLKRICEQSIVSSITVDNACQTLQAADRVDAQSLRKRTIEYISRHNDSVVKTEGFETLARTNVDLVLELVRR